MQVEHLEGLVAILFTPFTKDGKIDEKGIEYLVRYAIEKDLDGVVVLGSNAEFPYLRFEDKVQVMSVAVSAAGGKIPVIGTASAWSTEEAVNLARESKDAGCDAVMAALPLYFGLDFKDAVAHYENLAKSGGLPIYYYHFPDVTGLSVPPQDLARIAEIDGVIGAKITVVNRGFLKKVIDATLKFNWKVFTGTSFLLTDCLEFGGAGVFCPLPLIGPDDLKSLMAAFQRRDKVHVNKIQNKLFKGIPLFTGVNVPPSILKVAFKIMVRMPYSVGRRPFASHGLIKEAMRLQGHPITNKIRLPYPEVDQEKSNLVRKTMENLNWLE